MCQIKAERIMEYNQLVLRVKLERMKYFYEHKYDAYDNSLQNELGKNIGLG